METIESKISSDNVESLKTIIQQLNETITSVPEIRKIGENINRQLNSIIGSVYSLIFFFPQLCQMIWVL